MKITSVLLLVSCTTSSILAWTNRDVSSSKASTKIRSSSQLKATADANGSINGVPPTPKKILVLGGDGFCGWPTSLYLSDRGHDVVIVDNLSRRKIDIELGCDSLTPIQSPEVRCDKKSREGGWNKLCHSLTHVISFPFSVVFNDKS